MGFFDRINDIRNEDRGREKENLREEELRESYKICLEFFQRPGSTEEFDRKVMAMDKDLFQKGIHPDLQKISLEEKEKHIDWKYEKLISTIQDKIIDGKTIEEISKDNEYSYISAIRELNVEKPSGQIVPLEAELTRNYVKVSFSGLIDLRTRQDIDTNLSIRDIIGPNAKLCKPTREEYVERHCDISTCLRDNYMRDFKELRSTPIERDIGERLSESLQKMYDEKGIHNPTLQRGLEELRTFENGHTSFNVDYYAKTALSSFIGSLSIEEKMSLIPKDVTDQRLCMENMTFYPGYMDDIARPIYGYMNANQEMMDKIADYFKENDYRVVEVFSGNGLFSRMLQDRGVDIVATERYDPRENPYTSIKNQERFTEIIQMDARDAAKEYSDRDIILISWAPYGEKAASETLLEFHKNNPEGKAFVLTEPIEGCTMDTRSFTVTKDIDDPRIYEIDNLHNQFDGIHDSFHLWEINPDFEEEWRDYLGYDDSEPKEDDY